MTEPHALGVRDLAHAIATGALRPRVAVESCLDRIAAREPVVHAWEHLDAGAALARADALGVTSTRGLLHGVPVGVKDIVDVAGMPTRCGSGLRSTEPVTTDAWITRRLYEAGAIVLGKTVTTEFAYFTPGRTRNPRDPRRTPGGSSSGSAAAVADQMVPFGVGTQTAASTTRPAAYCGIAALVPTPGRYPMTGIAGLSPTLDALGLFARSVDDLVLVGEAVLHLHHVEVATPSLLVCAGAFAQPETVMLAAFADAEEMLREAGARIAAIPSPPDLRALVADHITVMSVEAARSLAKESVTGGLSAPLTELVETGRDISATVYQAALTRARGQRRVFLDHLATYDAVLAPAAQGPAPVGLNTGDPVLSRPWQAMGLPSVTVAGPRDGAGMPLGLQLVGIPGKESRLLATARWVERCLTGGGALLDARPQVARP